MSEKEKKSGKQKPSAVQIPMREEEGAARQLAAELPDDRAGLLAVGAAAVVACHTAVLAQDQAALEAAEDRYEAAVWKLNGGTFFASYADPDAAGRALRRLCSAVPGTVPMWGQSGEFLVTVRGTRCLVNFDNGMGSLSDAHFEFEVIDLDASFISETGYLSHHARAGDGLTLDQMACEIISGLLQSKRRYVRPADQARLSKQPLRPWLAALPSPPKWTAGVQDKDAVTPEAPPKGFVFVDVVLTEQQAFIVKKWAAAAAPKIKAGKAAEHKSRVYAKEKVAQPIKLVEPAAVAVRDESLKEICDSQSYHEVTDFYVGARCEITKTHSLCFAKDVGKVVVVATISLDSRQVFAYDDRPIAYRINRAGKRVVASDPRCIQTIYGMDCLRIIKSLPGVKHEHTSRMLEAC